MRVYCVFQDRGESFDMLIDIYDTLEKAEFVVADISSQGQVNGLYIKEMDVQ